MGRKEVRRYLTRAWKRFLRSKHAPFALFMLLAPFTVIVTFNDEAFMQVHSLVAAGPWGVVMALCLGFVLASLDSLVLAWVLRTKFLCGRYRKIGGIFLYLVPSIIWIVWWMQIAAGLNIATLTIGWRWPDWDVLLTTILMALFFVIFYDFLLKLASPAFSKLDYTVFHSALDQIITIVDDCQANELDIEELEDRERVHSHLLSLITQARTCLENNEPLETDQSTRESIQTLLKDLQRMSDQLQELEGRRLTKQQFQWQIWGRDPARGESQRNQRFRQVRRGECPCQTK